MKKLFTLSLLLISFSASADKGITPLDMELGYWETTIEIKENEMIRKMLANVPESQREMILGMMKSTLGNHVTKQCITEESLQDMDKQIRDSLADSTNEESCELNVQTSSRSEFSGEVVCKSSTTFISTKVINSKRNESTATTSAMGLGDTKIEMVANWKSSTCPAGV